MLSVPALCFLSCAFCWILCLSVPAHRADPKTVGGKHPWKQESANNGRESSASSPLKGVTLKLVIISQRAGPREPDVWLRTAAAYSNTLYGSFLHFPVCLLYFFTDAFWDLLPNKLLRLKSLFQCLLLGRCNLRQWANLFQELCSIWLSPDTKCPWASLPNCHQE